MKKQNQTTNNEMQATQVVLFNNSTNDGETFDFVQAENILKWQEKRSDKSFSLPDESEYDFIDGSLIKKTK
jgi:hypothetical protein